MVNMNVIFFLNFIAAISIFIYLIINFFKHYEKKRIKKIINFLLITGIFYFIISALYFLWSLDILNYSYDDFIFIYSIAIIFQSLFTFVIVYLISTKKDLFYLLFFYLMSFLSFFSPIMNFFNLVIIISFLFTALLFIRLSLRDDIYKKVGYIGIFYSAISLILQILLLMGFGELNIYILISNIIFIYLLYHLVRDLQKYPLTHLEYTKPKEPHYILSLFRHFVFLLILTTFIFIGTIGIHELGHFGMSKFYDCEYRRIVYEGNFPHTDILCKNIPNNLLILLGGVLTPIILAIIFFFAAGKFMKDISLLIIGFNLIASSKDFIDLQISENLIISSILLGTIFLITGIIFLAKSRVDISLDLSHNPIHHIDSENL